MSQGDQKRFIAAAGLTNHDGVGGGLLEPSPNGLGGVGNTGGVILMMDIESEFGNVDPDVDG